MSTILCLCVGKSTLVCAICLGLGGSPTSLARMDSLKGFIKEGQVEASIEVELYAAMTGDPDDGNRCIRRSFSENKSTYHELIPHSSGRGWREHEVTAKRVKELTTSFDVDVDNLCVLLAQDRVGKFAEMKPTERLQETEKAANMEYYIQHRRLIDLRKEEKDYEKTVVALTRSLESKKTDVEGMEPEMKRREERKEEEEKMVVMKRKRPWVEYREQEHKGNAAKEESDRLARQVEEEKTRQRPLKAVLKRATDEWKAAEKEKVATEAAASRVDSDRKNLVASLRALQRQRGEQTERDPSAGQGREGLRRRTAASRPARGHAGRDRAAAARHQRGQGAAAARP